MTFFHERVDLLLSFQKLKDHMKLIERWKVLLEFDFFHLTKAKSYN